MLTYDPATGQFYRDGKPVGRPRADGYVQVGFDKKNVYAHRLAWRMTYGEWPAGQIDHINGLRHDNRIANLRIATPSQNKCNSPLSARNTTGFKGVITRRGKFNARIFVNRKIIHLGDFPTAEEAHAAYCRAAKELHGEFARVR